MVFNCLCVNASSVSFCLLILVLFQAKSKQYDCSKEVGWFTLESFIKKLGAVLKDLNLNYLCKSTPLVLFYIVKDTCILECDPGRLGINFP